MCNKPPLRVERGAGGEVYIMRSNILNTIISDLTRITIANGYNHNSPAASKYHSTLDDISIAPKIVVQCASQFSTPTEAGLDNCHILDYRVARCTFISAKY